MNENDLVIETCASPHDPELGAQVGVTITHKPLNITVISTKEKSQFANKKAAIEKLKIELVKQRFTDIDEDDLMGAEELRKWLDEL